MARFNFKQFGKGKARVLTPADLEQVASTAAENARPERNTALLALSFGQGLRVKELASLSIGDVFTDQGDVRETVMLASHQTKEGRPRQIYLTNPKVRLALKAYLASRLADHKHAVAPGSPLFLSNKGNRFTPNSLQQVFKRIYRLAGIDGASSHSGRRTYATRLAMAGGADIRLIAISLGHKGLDVTQGYVEYGAGRLKQLAEIVF